MGFQSTEYRYVDNMRTTERYRFSLVPGIPKHSDIDDIVNLAKGRVYAGYDYVLCLIDMDVIEGNHDKMEHYRALKKANPKIIFVESNPCTEYWFLMHYMPGPSSKEYADYDAVAQELKKQIRRRRSSIRPMWCREMRTNRTATAKTKHGGYE